MEKFKIIILFGILFFFASCQDIKLKQFCSELSQECELQKDFAIIKILQNNENGFDAYGTSLHLDEWYLHSTKSGAILPFEWDGMNPASVTPPELQKLLAGEFPVSNLKRIKTFKTDTIVNFTIPSKTTGATIQVITKVVLLETDGYFDVFYDGKGRKVTFFSQKETAENPTIE